MNMVDALILYYINVGTTKLNSLCFRSVSLKAFRFR